MESSNGDCLKNQIINTKLNVTSKEPLISNEGDYFNDGERRVDFVLVYRNIRQWNQKIVEIERRRKFYMEQLEIHGLEIEKEEIQDSDETIFFVKVHAPFSSLRPMAEHSKIEMPLKLGDQPIALFRHQIGEMSDNCFNCYYCFGEKRNDADNRTTIYYPFSSKEMDSFQIEKEKTFFSDSQRNEMVWEILQNIPNHPDDEKMRGVESLLQNEIFETCYPIHKNYSEKFFRDNRRSNTLRQKLKDSWADWRNIFSQQPLHDIRCYFGEKIGFYFVYMDFYTKQLMFPSLTGLIIFIIGMTLYWKDDEIEAICDENSVPGKYWMCPICELPYCQPWLMSKDGCTKYKWEFALDNEGTLGLSCIVLLWAMLFLKFWKRRESVIASEWNTYNFQSQLASIRPEYEKRAPKIKTNAVTLEIEPHVPFLLRITWISLSILAALSILFVYCLCLSGILLSRIALYRAFKKAGGHFAEYNIDYSRWCINFFTFALVTITAKTYNKLVLKLTLLECPRTQHQFMSSLLWKLFLFEMVNEFIPICYAAWLKGRFVETPLHLNVMSELCDAGCMAEVVELVFILLFARLLFGNALEIGIPVLKNCMKTLRRKNLDKNNDSPQWLKDYYLNEVALDGVYEEYMEMMIQFAFIVFFISAFPLAPLLCLINNIVEIRLDAVKLLRANRRPVPVRVGGIQIWNRFLDIILKLGVLFNAALIAFTSDIVPRLFYVYNSSGTVLDKVHQFKHRGFTAYSLSYINASDWNDPEQVQVFTEKGIDRCYYPGYREPYHPYPYKAEFWRLATVRVIAFAVYSLVFFLIMWVINTTISDEPHRIKVKAARQNVITKRYFKAEGRKVTPKDSVDYVFEMKKGTQKRKIGIDDESLLSALSDGDIIL